MSVCAAKHLQSLVALQGNKGQWTLAMNYYIYLKALIWDAAGKHTITPAAGHTVSCRLSAMTPDWQIHTSVSTCCGMASSTSLQPFLSACTL